MFQIIVTGRDELDDLLARGRLGAPRRERIFEELYGQVHGRPFLRSKLVVVAGPLALAASLFLLLRPHGAAPGGYASKGTAGSQVEVSCSAGELSHCPRGSKLMFHLDGLPASGFFHAFAEPEEKGTERVWYFPTNVSPPPRVAPLAEGQTMDRGILVGTEHAQGRYRVHVVIASRPLSREELLQSQTPDVITANVIDMVIVDP